MKRLDNIEKLQEVQYNIEHYDRLLVNSERWKSENFFFGTQAELDHEKEVCEKSKAYWKRRFNRILKELEY